MLGACREDCHQHIPFWWSGFEFVFISVSFVAIFISTKRTSSHLIKPLFWLSWSLMCMIILNEKAHLFELPEFLIYIPSTLLILAHIYNLKYCMCVEESESCCAVDRSA